MKTQKMKVSELKHPERNVRKHPKKQIEEMQRSLNMFGQIRPVVVDENNVIMAGNGLVEALREQGTETAEVLKVKDLSEKDKKKLMIADNRIYSLGFDHHDNIFEFLGELDGDFEVPGYDEELLKDLLADEEEVEEELENYGKLDKEEIQELEKAGERVDHKIENNPYEEKEEDTKPIEQSNAIGSEQEQTAPDGTENDSGHAEYAQGVEEANNTDSEAKPCPHCGGTGWL